MATILCLKNEGYRWTERDNCHFKGYLQTENGPVISGGNAIAFFNDLDSYDAFRNALKTHYGLFLVIVERGEEIWIGTDIARSMPLYYTEDLEYLSDDVDGILERVPALRDAKDDFRMLELYTSSFVGFSNTVFRHIKQLELGCTARIRKGSVQQMPYYIHGGVSNRQSENRIERLREATDHMIQRLLAAAAGRQIVLSLSGGYDSRYIACSLKKRGVDDIICYTYGRADSFEVAQSKKVAEALGYRWHNVTYDDESVRSILANEGAYLDYANRPDYIVYLQNYLAVKALHDGKLIPSDSVFITGLCNDMPTGYYIPTEEEAGSYGYSTEGLAEYNIAQRFVKFNLSQAARDRFKTDVKQYLERMSVRVTDYQSFVGALDCLETANFHSRCYLNMNAVHGFFGYEWLLPCWDRELLDYWYALKAEDRIGQKTYEEYITQHLASQYGIGSRKHINASATSPSMRKLKRKIGAILVKVAYPLGIPIRRNTDINDMSVLEVELYKRIRQKKAIKPDRAALILLLTIYMMERRYGTDWYPMIKGYLDNIAAYKGRMIE